MLDTAMNEVGPLFEPMCQSLYKAMLLNRMLAHQDLSDVALERLRKARREVMEAMGVDSPLRRR